MTSQADLSILELPDLLQNLEIHRRSGHLCIEGELGTSHLQLEEGCIVAMAGAGSGLLLDALEDAGWYDEAALAGARKKAKRGRKTVGERLVDAGVLTSESLDELAGAYLLECVCALLVTKTTGFAFDEGVRPKDVFDEELPEISRPLSVSATLLESARRQDHWQLIKQRVPSSSQHFAASAGMDLPSQVDPELATALLARLDGTRSAAEAMAAFPHCRFQAYQVLAELCSSHCARPLGADDLLQLAGEVESQDPERAWTLLDHGLSEIPRHPGLLEARARMGLELGHEAEAGEAFKQLSNLRFEAGALAEARVALVRARELDPSDASLWERGYDLARETGDVELALYEGVGWADSLRAQGLHLRAKGVIEVLLREFPENWALRLELARCLANCGEVSVAVAALEKAGKESLAAAEDDRARSAYAEILELDPKHQRAQETLRDIDNRVFLERRVRRKRLFQRSGLIVIAGLLGAGLLYECMARRAYLAATAEVANGELIEWQFYSEAAQVYSTVSERFPYSPTAVFDVAQQLESLQERGASSADSAEFGSGLRGDQ